MDKARPFEYVYRLPTATIDELRYAESVYDRQVLLNETWRSYALRKGRLDEVDDEHVKWITRTWDEEEQARIDQKTFLDAANAQGEDQISAREENFKSKQAKSAAAVAHVMAFQERILSSRIACRHNLYVDFDLFQENKFIGEQDIVCKEEEFLRLFQEKGIAGLCDFLFLIGECHKAFCLMKLHDRLRREEEERRRIAEEHERAIEEERRREEARQKELEEAERIRKESLEQAKMLERKRREEERRSKARSERERLKHQSVHEAGLFEDKSQTLIAVEEVPPVTGNFSSVVEKSDVNIPEQKRIVFVLPEGNDIVSLIRSASFILGSGGDTSYVMKIDKMLMKSTVVCQNGCYLEDPHENETFCLLGKTIMEKDALAVASKKLHGASTDLFEQYISSRVEYIENSRTDNGFFLFDTTVGKRDEATIFLPLMLSGFSYAPYVFAVSRHGENSFLSTEVKEAARVVWELGLMIESNLQNKRKTQLCQQCVDWLSVVTGCENCYVSLQDMDSNSMTYVAASLSHRFMIGKKHDLFEEKQGCGISFNACESATVQGDCMVFCIDNVNDVSCIPFQNQRVKTFLKGEKTGSLLVGTITGRKLNDECISLGVVFLDYIGKEKKFTDSDKEIMKTAVQILAKLLLNPTNVLLLGKPLKIEDEIKNLGTSPILFLKSLWNYTLDNVGRITPDQLLELARYMHPPPIIPLVVQATIIIALGSKPKSIEQWTHAREKVNNNLLTKMSAFDPTDKTRRKKSFFIRAGRMLKGYGARDVLEKGSYPTSCFFSWTFAAILLRKHADVLRQRGEEDVITNLGADAALLSIDDNNLTDVEVDDDMDSEEIECEPEEE